MTEQEAAVAEAERLYGLATPGPWEMQDTSDEGIERGEFLIVGRELQGLVAAALPQPTEIDRDEFSRVKANGLSIAALHNIAPFLFAAYRERERLREALEAIDALAVLEINPSNYTHDDVCELNSAAVQAALIARRALSTEER